MSSDESEAKGSVKPAVIDIFSGAGGLSYGLKSAGLRPVAGLDNDASCQFAFETNTAGKFLHRDVSDVSAEEINRLFGKSKIRVLAGCAPCQPFSTYSQSRRSGDDRWKLLRQFGRLVEGVLPEFITAENVTRIARNSIWDEFVDAMVRLGYSVSYEEVACEEYGLPQHRRRMVLIGSRIGKAVPATAIAVASRRTVRDAIGELPAILAGEQSDGDPLHMASSLSKINLDRIRASKPGGTWRDWPSKLVAECHRRSTGSTYPSVYGRMAWSEPAPTITTQCYAYGSGRFGHPEQDRAISLREAATLQGFPENYAFVPPGRTASFRNVGAHIGNAVPPLLGEIVGKAILSSLNSR